MSRTTDRADEMWAHALDLLGQAERMHRQFFRLASSAHAPTSWEPPADVFEDERELVIVVAMPGVLAERIQVVSEAGVLAVRGERALPLAGSRHTIRQLEIPYGRFERRLPLPEGRFEIGVPELTHGCLIVRLSKVS